MNAAAAQSIEALNGGYQLAFLIGAVFAAVAAKLGVLLIRTRAATPAQGEKPARRAVAQQN